MHNKMSFQFYYAGVFLQAMAERGEGGEDRKVQLFSLAIRHRTSADMKVNLTVKLGTWLKALFLALYILEIQTMNNQD